MKLRALAALPSEVALFNGFRILAVCSDEVACRVNLPRLNGQIESRFALQHKKDLASLIAAGETLSTRQGLSVGAVWLVFDITRQLGIVDALGPSRDGKLGLWQVVARVIDQGSRLSAVRLAGSHAACDILGLGTFNEDHLYANLDWLACCPGTYAETSGSMLQKSQQPHGIIR